jgi:membrane protease YdiL (CAAX protease family)
MLRWCFEASCSRGFGTTRLGDAGAIVLASVAWASLHVQYDWFYIGQIFVLGLLLGAARVRTRSLVPPMAMHALFSGIARLQAALESWK